MCSRGPAYDLPSTLEHKNLSFGTDAQRLHQKQKYPDPSVDVLGNVVDSQAVKYPATQGVHFGTERRGNRKNGEIIQINPSMVVGIDSTAAFEYTPDDKPTAHSHPHYSFGPKQSKLGEKHPPRIPLKYTATPRHTGPGAHDAPSSIGRQASSKRTTSSSFSFGHERRMPPLQRRGLLETSANLSSLGKQVVSSVRTAPKVGFGTSTREDLIKTQLVRGDGDRGPGADMPKVTFHKELQDLRSRSQSLASEAISLLPFNTAHKVLVELASLGSLTAATSPLPFDAAEP
eukprot:CAMPEP_0194521408 /NCGR_PEP_ID=MMETSP0253-20130528/55720_1 /TAXON_ID=2966 /ORGANISM="Noctiluca scintillans" /LENGTH=287 /DNA_ID=CAMNT_0039365763 /DNA_START=150 /DNA_END=1014 /DNA_ORIENTATION=-